MCFFCDHFIPPTYLWAKMGGVARPSFFDRALNNQQALGLTPAQIDQIMQVRESIEAASLPLIAQAAKARMDFERIIDVVPFSYQAASAAIAAVRQVGEQLDMVHLDKVVEATNILTQNQVDVLLGIYDTQAAEVLLNLVDTSLSAQDVTTIQAKAQEIIDTLTQNPDPDHEGIRDLAKLMYDQLFCTGIQPIWKDS